ncbi:MAG: hypothetical protein M1826_005772 [Phylliscum demangeonii]|nr:MAG: hypothetical protein M1826_005772 [Phylliscum demangeonii]
MAWLAVELREQVSDELERGYRVEGLEQVRVIKDRQTGVSRQFGFLHFTSIDAARAFLEPNYPAIYLYGNAPTASNGSSRSQAVKVRVSFCRERDDKERVGKPEDEWACHVCSFPNFSRRAECRTPLTAAEVAVAADAPAYHYLNTGDSDVSPDGSISQFLLFRGLEPAVTTQLLAKGAAKLYKPRGASPPVQEAPGKKAGAKVASTTAETNLGAKEGSLRRVLLVKDRRTDESWKYGFVEFATVEDSQAALTKFNALDKFTISSKPVLLSFIHSGVFVPVGHSGPVPERFTFSPLNNASVKLAYWDEDAYVSELMLASEEAPNTSGGASSTGKQPGVVAAEKDGIVKAIKETENKSKKRKADGNAAAAANKKAVPAHLDFWRSRHAELHGISTKETTTSTNGPGPTEDDSKDSEPSDSAPPTKSYADLARKCCLLCARQFTSDADVHKHERLSQLHRRNLQDETKKTHALAKLAKSGPAYRDRAKERRAAFNQPKRPVPAAGAAATSVSAAAVAAVVGAAGGGDEPVAVSKGASLLGKMGWTAGEGLGAQGTGITAPVRTEMYAQGVGLGAQGGKVGDALDEASRKTTGGYGQFLERTKEIAHERFRGMS